MRKKVKKQGRKNGIKHKVQQILWNIRPVRYSFSPTLFCLGKVKADQFSTCYVYNRSIEKNNNSPKYCMYICGTNIKTRYLENRINKFIIREFRIFL